MAFPLPPRLPETPRRWHCSPPGTPPIREPRESRLRRAPWESKYLSSTSRPRGDSKVLACEMEMAHCGARRLLERRWRRGAGAAPADVRRGRLKPHKQTDGKRLFLYSSDFVESFNISRSVRPGSLTRMSKCSGVFLFSLPGEHYEHFIPSAQERERESEVIFAMMRACDQA